jgi:hypothetical protein
MAYLNPWKNNRLKNALKVFFENIGKGINTNILNEDNYPE